MRTALALLTVLPVGRRPLPEIRVGGLLAFPLVGALVGLLWGAAASVGTTWWGPPVAAAVVLVLDAAVTGGLHYDGLADVGDVVGSRRRGPAALEVARDPRVGAVGVLALSGTLLLRFALLASLLTVRGAWVLVAVPVVGRVAMLHALHRCAPDRHSLALPVAARAGPLVSAVALLAAAAALVLTGASAARTAASLTGAWLAVEGGAWWWRRRVGEASGDLVGALGLSAESVVLLVLAAG